MTSVASRLPALLAANVRRWKALPIGLHVAAVGLLGLVVAVRWWRLLSIPDPLVDENVYLGAFHAVAAGESPYTIGGYFYPEPFARVGGWLVDRLGGQAVLVGLRVIRVLGLAVSIWCSLAWLGRSWLSRLGVAAAYLVVAPAVASGLRTGNISFAVTGCILAALVWWPQRPVPMGILLGLSVAIKPLAPLAILALLLHRPIPESRRHWAAGTAALLTAGLCLLPWAAQLRELSRQPVEWWAMGRSVSMQGLFRLGGLQVSPLVVVLGIALLTAGIARRWPMDWTHLLCLATTASILATPLVWGHTFLLVLPVQVVAILVVAHRVRDSRAGPKPPESTTRGTGMGYEVALVLLATAAIQLSEGAGLIRSRAAWIQLLPLLLPVLAPAVLTGYVFWALPPVIPSGCAAPVARERPPAAPRDRAR